MKIITTEIKWNNQNSYIVDLVLNYLYCFKTLKKF